MSEIEKSVECVIDTTKALSASLDDLIKSNAQDSNPENLIHFKAAYSRALNFVCEQRFSFLPLREGDDPFFCSPIENCCATDVLIEQIKQLQARLLAVKG